jgi:hypothetical protein
MNVCLLCLGGFIGFLPAFAATDVDKNGGWWGFFLFGTILTTVVGLVALGFALVQRFRDVPGPLDKLADRMAKAKDENRAKEVS